MNRRLSALTLALAASALAGGDPGAAPPDLDAALDRRRRAWEDNRRPPPPERATHPSHHFTGGVRSYCSVCLLSQYDRGAVCEPCIGSPHPDAPPRLREAVEKRARKAARRGKL